MKYTYTITNEDYIDSHALQKANARENKGMFHLIFFLALACATYLNAAVMRNRLDTDDVFSYALAGAVLIIFLLHYSPRIVPSLLIALRRFTDPLPAGTLGPHTVEVREDCLVFASQVSKMYAAYSALQRLNHNDKIVLFYFSNGTVQAVPLRAFGMFNEERTAALSAIQEHAKKASGAQAVLPLQGDFEGTAFETEVTEADVLIADRYAAFSERRKKARSPYSLFTLAFALFCAAGGLYGLIHADIIPEKGRVLVILFYVVEIIAALFYMLTWYKPSGLRRALLTRMLAAQQYFPGYVGPRAVCFNEKGLSIAFGAYCFAFPYRAFTSVINEGKEILFFRKEEMALFIPAEGVPAPFTEQFKKTD